MARIHAGRTIGTYLDVIKLHLNNVPAITLAREQVIQCSLVSGLRFGGLILRY
jgi:hypothetical protein